MRSPSPSPLLRFAAGATLTLAAATSASAAESQLSPSGDWVVEVYTTADGLRIPHLTGLAQTEDGYLWMTTFDGLVRFDGVEFQMYRSADHPDLHTNRLTHIRPGADGALWILTEDESLVRFADGAFRTWRAGQDLPAGAYNFLQGDPGLWVQTRGTVTAEPDSALAPRRWRGHWARLPEDLGPDEDLAFEAASLWVVAADQLGETDAALDERLGRTSDALERWAGARGRSAYPLLCRAPEGATLVDHCTFFRRASGAVLDPAAAGRPETDWALSPDGVRTSIRDLAEIGRLNDDLWDQRGHLWLASSPDAGLRVVRPTAVEPLITDTPEADGVITRVRVGPDGAVYIGPHLNFGTWLRWDGDRGAVSREAPARCESDPDRCARQRPFEDDEGAVVWVDRELFELPRDTDGGQWRTSRGGLYRDDQLIFPAARQARLQSLTPDTTGGMWIGTAGAGLLHHADGGLTALTTADGLPSDRVRGTTLVGDDLWAAMENAGLCRIRGRGARIDCLGTRDGLHDDALHSVTLDDFGRLWFSSNMGIFWASLSDLEAVTDGRAERVSCVAYGERDGMRSREVNGASPPQVAVDPQGRLLYPTQKGVVRVDPARLPAPEAPQVRLESVSVHGEPLPAAALADGVTLPPDHRQLSVRWSAPDLQWGQQVQYQYRVVGLDDAWSPLGPSRSAQWSSLPAGDFQLEVVSRLGGAQSEPLVFPVTRLPAFVETRWYPLSLGLLGLLLAGGGAVWWSRRLRARQAELERLVDDRTHALAERNQDLHARTEQLAQQAQVLQTQKSHIETQAQELAQLDRAKTRFMANMSHELRSPMTLVLGPLEDLDADRLPPADRRAVAMARRNAARLSRLIDQVFDVARIDNDGIQLRVRPTDLGAFLGRVAERFEWSAAQAQVELALDLPPEPVEVFLDPHQIDRVVSNLLSNALKFTPAGGRVTVSAQADELDGVGACARLSVSDTGVGISVDDQPRVFERFFQVEDGDARRFEGAGLGLALSRELVQLHGGDIEVRSACGEGTTFTVALPLGVAHLQPDDILLTPRPADEDLPARPLDRPPAPASPAAPPDDAGRPDLVLVEDNPDMRAYLAAHLRERFAVREAGNGVEALAAIAERRPAVVVSDVMMPEMDGLALGRALRADPDLATLPLLLVSAKGGEQDRLEGLAVADDYVSKPFSMPELVLRVQRLARPLRQPAAAAPGAVRSDGQTNGAADGLAGPELPEVDREFLERLHAALDAHLSTPRFTTASLAKEMAVSARTLQRELQRLLERSPTEAIREHRLAAAQEMLEERRFATIGEVAAATGFSRAYFTRAYTAWAGHPPGDDQSSS